MKPIRIQQEKIASQELLQWYDAYHRDLPWRRNVSAYTTWISEIMLQQTRVTAVLPYYASFLETFPTISALANAEEETLMKCWEGLGYYSRARNLQKAAQVVLEQFDGVLPESEEALLTLPGIGPYTAGAISSIAYGKPVPAVDGNLLRVFARLWGSKEDVLEDKTKQELVIVLRQVIPQDRPGDYNQALMDLGATVCLPNGAPLCDVCPWKKRCSAHENGLEGVLPVRKGKKARRQEQRTVFLLWEQGKVALRQREKKGLLAGLWEFPSVEGNLTETQVAEILEEQGIHILQWQKQLQATHIFSHVEWHMTGYVVEVKQKQQTAYTWATQEIFTQKAIPSAFARFVADCETRWEENK